MVSNFYLKRLRTEYTVIIVFVALKITLQVISLSNSGYFSDEFLHIEAGRHPADGYVGFPPMIAILAWIQNLFNSDSIFINHLFNFIASALIIIFCGLTTMRLGGKWLAVLITLLCIVFSPGMAGIQFLFLPNVFEQLFWIICIYYLVAFCRSENNNYLILFCVFAALGFLTRYSTAFFLVGVVVSAIFFRKSIFFNKGLRTGLLIFFVLVAANILWQIKNDFPVFHHFSQLYDKQLNNLSMFDELKKLILFLNPLTSVLWIPALFIIPFLPAFKEYRLVSFALFLSFLLLFIAKGKWYYFFPIILGIIPVSAVIAEQIFNRKKLIIYCSLFLIGIAGIILLPQGIPILKLDRYIKLYNLKPNSDNKIPLSFDNYYSAGIWDQTLEIVRKTYMSLPQDEKEKCLVWGRHYSHAAGINLLGRKYGLPQAFSLHPSFEWVPEFGKDAVIIAIGEANWIQQNWEAYFENVVEAGVVENRYASKQNDYCYRIFLCRGLKYSSDELRQLFRN